MPSFDAFAVNARSGPHVTIQAGTTYMGRHWTTATRKSVKAASIRRSGWAAITTAAGSGWQVKAGDAKVLDVASPSSLIGAALDTALAGGAILRLGLGQLTQLVGYAETGTGVPSNFLPAGRVLLVTHMTGELVLDGHDVVAARGRWCAPAKPDQPRPGSKRLWEAERVLAHLPDVIRELASEQSSCWLGVTTAAGAVPLPGRFDPDAGTCVVSRAAVEHLAADASAPMCITLDDSASRRPDEKVGMMLRGVGSVVDSDACVLHIRLDVEHVTSWSGFESSTISV